MLLQWLGEKRSDASATSAADAIDRAVSAALGRSVKTPDLGGSASTADFTSTILKHLDG